jgi:formyl-CoA transferase
VTAAFAILAGLAHRSRTGEGCAVETSLYDNAVFAQTPLLAWSELAGAAPPRLGNRSPLALIVEADCSDGPLMIALPTDKLWRRLCAAIEREDLSDDPRFGGVSDRLRHQLDIANELRAGFAARTKAEWEEDLVAAGVPCAPVRDYVEVLADRQLAENDMLLTMEHPMTGAFRVVGNPVRSTGWTVGVERRSPLLGEHSDEVLREYGVPDDLVAALRAGGS